MDREQAPSEPKMRLLTASEAETALRVAAIAHAAADTALEAQGLKFKLRLIHKEPNPACS